MNVLKLIQHRKNIRKYKDRAIPKRLLDKVLEAGRWAPSLHHIQPWKFLLIDGNVTIEKIADLVINRLKEVESPGFFLTPTIKALKGTRYMIAVFSTGVFVDFQKKIFSKEINNKFFEVAKKSELLAISAAIQNMILTAHSLGIGSCWLSTPLFCKEEVSKLLNMQEELVSVITLGYPDEKSERSPRKPLTETVQYIIEGKEGRR